MKMIQVTLSKVDSNAFMTTWLDYDKRIKQGVKLTLKDEEGLWEVQETYGMADRATVESNRGWDNNDYGKYETKSMKERMK